MELNVLLFERKERGVFFPEGYSYAHKTSHILIEFFRIGLDLKNEVLV